MVVSSIRHIPNDGKSGTDYAQEHKDEKEDEKLLHLLLFALHKSRVVHIKIACHTSEPFRFSTLLTKRSESNSCFLFSLPSAIGGIYGGPRNWDRYTVSIF